MALFIPQLASIDDLTIQFLELYPNRVGSMVKHQSGPWRAVSRFYDVPNEEIVRSISSQQTLIRAMNWDTKTKFTVLNIDSSSKYHNQLSVWQLQNTLAQRGVHKIRIYQSSGSTGWHVYIFWNDWVCSSRSASVISSILLSSGFEIGPQALEVFPSQLPLRLPLQAGFAWLNESGRLIVHRNEISLEGALSLFMDEVTKFSNEAAWLDSDHALDVLRLSEHEEDKQSASSGYPANETEHAFSASTAGGEQMYFEGNSFASSDQTALASSEEHESSDYVEQDIHVNARDVYAINTESMESYEPVEQVMRVRDSNIYALKAGPMQSFEPNEQIMQDHDGDIYAVAPELMQSFESVEDVLQEHDGNAYRLATESMQSFEPVEDVLQEHDGDGSAVATESMQSFETVQEVRQEHDGNVYELATESMQSFETVQEVQQEHDSDIYAADAESMQSFEPMEQAIHVRAPEMVQQQLIDKQEFDYSASPSLEFEPTENRMLVQLPGSNGQQSRDFQEPHNPDVVASATSATAQQHPGIEGQENRVSSSEQLSLPFSQAGNVREQDANIVAPYTHNDQLPESANTSSKNDVDDSAIAPSSERPLAILKETGVIHTLMTDDIPEIEYDNDSEINATTSATNKKRMDSKSQAQGQVNAPGANTSAVSGIHRLNNVMNSGSTEMPRRKRGFRPPKNRQVSGNPPPMP